MHEPTTVLPSVATVVMAAGYDDQTAVPLVVPSTQALVTTVPGAAAGPKVWVKLAQHEPTAQVESSEQAVLLAVRLFQALLLMELMQVHVLTTLLTLKPTPLNQRGAQTVAAVATGAVPLTSLAQQWVPGHESVVPVAVAVQEVEYAVATVTLLGGIEVAVCWRVGELWRSLLRN